MFGRLPYLSRKGEKKYLDLLVMRGNAHLKNLPFFYVYCKALYFWTNSPLDHYDHTIPVIDEEDEGDKEDGEDEDFGEDEYERFADSDDSDFLP